MTARKQPSTRQPRPVWKVHAPAFAADAVCPLMPVWPWGGHRGWAYDLVRFMKPAVIAELGVHWGTSLFAFAQAVKDGKLTAHMIGVDTWAGDGHTGPYGSEVLATVRRIVNEHFPRQSFELHPMTFDEALPKIADESVNLLHIDGFHEYDAVKHDFETWLCKLAPDGVVLLHDVAETTGYGSARYWKELTEQYPGFAFTHSWGLGVIFPKGDRWFKAIQKQNLADKMALYTYRSLHERMSIELRDTGQMAVSRLAAMDTMEAIIKDRDFEIKLLKSIVGDRENEITLLKGFVADRDNWLKAAGQETDAFRGRAEGLAAEAASLRERAENLDRSLTAANQVAERVPELEARAAQETSRADAAEASLASRVEEIRSLTDELARTGADLARTAGELSAAQDRGRELESTVQSLAAALDLLTTQHQLVTARLSAAEERGATMAADMHSMTIRIAAEHERNAALERSILENNAMTDRLKSDLRNLEADLEMLALRVEQLERVEIEREKKEGVRRTERRDPASVRRIGQASRDPSR
ncbi:MAG: hypothetical protein AMXMBFR58_31320 [Phycisphaerae bacterium]